MPSFVLSIKPTSQPIHESLLLENHFKIHLEDNTAAMPDGLFHFICLITYLPWEKKKICSKITRISDLVLY